MSWIKLIKDLEKKHGKVLPAGTCLEVTAELKKDLIEAGIAVAHVPIAPSVARIDPKVARQIELAKRKEKEQELAAPVKTEKPKK